MTRGQRRVAMWFAGVYLVVQLVGAAVGAFVAIRYGDEAVSILRGITDAHVQ